mmetsp:Transcript_11344/g.27533  ORF Transcript_11344/g.27533 Transcript_11344/m.27533 type:complete len:242 (-) Transcript_11344:947-1672(-)
MRRVRVLCVRNRRGHGEAVEGVLLYPQRLVLLSQCLDPLVLGRENRLVLFEVGLALGEVDDGPSQPLAQLHHLLGLLIEDRGGLGLALGGAGRPERLLQPVPVRVPLHLHRLHLAGGLFVGGDDGALRSLEPVQQLHRVQTALLQLCAESLHRAMFGVVRGRREGAREITERDPGLLERRVPLDPHAKHLLAEGVDEGLVGVAVDHRLVLDVPRPVRVRERVEALGEVDVRGRDARDHQRL